MHRACGHQSSQRGVRGHSCGLQRVCAMKLHNEISISNFKSSNSFAAFANLPKLPPPNQSTSSARSTQSTQVNGGSGPSSSSQTLSSYNLSPSTEDLITQAGGKLPPSPDEIADDIGDSEGSNEDELDDSVERGEAETQQAPHVAWTQRQHLQLMVRLRDSVGALVGAQFGTTCEGSTPL